MSNVAYEIGQISYQAGESGDSGEDEFFMSWIMDHLMQEGEVPAIKVIEAGLQWHAGWLAAEQEGKGIR